MSFEEFARLAARMWGEIPPDLKSGVEAVAVEKATVEHDGLDGVFTLGECLTDDYGGPDEVRSHVVLYHGSFAALSLRDPGFDWEGELWETLLHELLHHREAAAGQAGLDEYDWAAGQNHRRHAGQPFDPRFYAAVPRAADGTVRLDSEIFVEALVSSSATEIPFEWRGRTYSVRVPAHHPAFVEIANLAHGRLWLVVRRQRPWWRRLSGAPPRQPLELSRRALPIPASGPMM